MCACYVYLGEPSTGGIDFQRTQIIVNASVTLHYFGRTIFSYFTYSCDQVVNLRAVA